MDHFAAHPGVDAFDLFAHRALVPRALHDEMGISQDNAVIRSLVHCRVEALGQEGTEGCASASAVQGLGDRVEIDASNGNIDPLSDISPIRSLIEQGAEEWGRDCGASALKYETKLWGQMDETSGFA
jgi:hypothetical protein